MPRMTHWVNDRIKHWDTVFKTLNTTNTTSNTTTKTNTTKKFKQQQGGRGREGGRVNIRAV
jgi:hypothetical protein